jgi:hypothetical protein
MPDVPGLTEVLAGLGLDPATIAGGIAFAAGLTALIKNRIAEIHGKASLIAVGVNSVVYSWAVIGAPAKAVIIGAIVIWAASVLTHNLLVPKPQH